MGATAMTLDPMAMIGKPFRETPSIGAPPMTWHRPNEGQAANGRRVMRLMRRMPVSRKPHTRRPAKGHKTDPYRLGGRRVERSGQVGCADITELPMKTGVL